MRLIHLAIIAIIVCACEPIYGPHNGRGIEVNEDIAQIANQEKALLYTQGAIADYYGEEFGQAWWDAVVYWTDTPCPYGDHQASVIVGDTCYAGIMWSCVEMYVAVATRADPEKICRSSLAHEFGHCLYIIMRGHGNSSHDDREFWGLIEDVDQEICARDW